MSEIIFTMSFNIFIMADILLALSFILLTMANIKLLMVNNILASEKLHLVGATISRKQFANA